MELSEKKTLSAKAILADIRAGATNDFLMKRYGLSDKGLQSLFKKLLDIKAITQTELDQRLSRAEPEIVEIEVIEETPSPLPRTGRVPQKSAPTQEPDPPAAANTPSVYKCPSCGLPQNYEFKVCPQCGVIVEKVLKKKSPTAGFEPQASGESTAEGHAADHEKIADTPVPPRAAAGHETFNKAAGQVVDKAKDLRDKIAGSPVFGRMSQFIKVPRNAAIIGGVSLLLVITAYLVYTKTEQRRQQREAATIAFIETIKESSRFEPNLNLIKDLIDQGADVNALIEMKTGDGPPDRVPALVPLSGMGHAETVRLLLEKGANPNLRAQIGVVGNNPPLDTVTALMFASGRGHAGIVMMLLKAGADPNAMSGTSGRTALDSAIREGKTQVIQILKAHGAKEGPKK